MPLVNIFSSLKRIDTWITLLFSVVLGTVVVLSLDLSHLYQGALFAGIIGFALFTTLPNKRIMLVVAWIMLHPLSIEKVFMFGKPLLPEFLPPRTVLSASDLVFLALLFYLLFESFYSDEKVWLISSPILPFSLLTFWVLIEFMLHSSNVESGLTLLHTAKMLLFLVIFSSAIRNREELILVLVAVAIALSIQVFLVIFSHFSSHVFHISSKVQVELLKFSGVSGSSYLRATGTVGHVNQEACFLTFFSFPLIGLLAAKNGWWRLSIAILLILSFFAIILTFSRSAWVSCAIAIVAIAVFLFRNQTYKETIWLYIFPLLIALSIAFLGLHQSVLDRLFHGDEGATASRKRAILLSIDLFKIHPLVGVGPGNFVRATLKQYPPEDIRNIWMKPGKKPRPLAYRYGRLEVNQIKIKNKTYVVPLPVHNKYLLILTELGFVGFSLFMWFIFRLYKLTLTCLKTSDTILLFTAFGAIGAFWSILSYMNLDLFADDKTVEILLFAPVIIMSLSRIVQNSEKEISA